jgi:PQQ-dependent catabolism-associated CXXCW motif protein
MIARLAFVAALCASPALAQVAEPDAYRMEAFRAPVPATLTGATVVDTEAVETLWRDGGAVFIDVLPRAEKPANLPTGTIWRDKPRDSIPGAIWLPNVGYGALADVTDAYFRDGLSRATGGDADRAVVFFCLRDCWMSWNAARRAITEYGYTQVYWYPDGTDGWSDWMLPLERVSPQ